MVIIRFGGGVRRLETILPDHPNFAPRLLHDLVPLGTLWENVVMEPRTATHSLGTINLTTGSYFPGGTPEFAEEVIPHVPTIFEVARKQLNLGMTEALVINNYIFGELVGWSRHPDFGATFQPGLMSFYEREKVWIDNKMRGSTLTPRSRDQLELAREWLLKKHYRNDLESDQVIQRYFSEHCREFGQTYARGDELVFDFACDALDLWHPRLLMVNFHDTDYVHWGIPYFYTEGIRRMDAYVWQLHRKLQLDAVYRDNTYLFIAPDCGRSTNPRRFMPYQHHWAGEPGSHELFILCVGPGVAPGRRIRALRQQIDLAPSVGSVLGVRSPFWDGTALDGFET